MPPRSLPPRRPRPLLALALALLAGPACTSRGGLPPGEAPPDAAAPEDAAPGTDGAGAQDLRPVADLSLPDPATCPVGVRDGCCPLLRHGGSDPDCPSLACGKLSQSAPVALDPPPIGAGRDGAGEVAMAWTGRELALAWTYSTAMSEYRLLFQRRGPGGDLSAGPVDSALPGAASPAIPGPTALAYSPAQRRFAFAHTPTLLRYAAAGLDEGGAPQWGLGLGELCNALWVHVDAFDTPAGWVIGQQNLTCAGSTYQPRADLLDAAGKIVSTWMLGDGDRPQLTLNAVFAYEPANKRLLTVFSRNYEDTLGGRYLDLAPVRPQAGWTLRPGMAGYPYERIGLAFDGQRYGVLTEERPAYSTFYQFFQIYDPAMKSWVGERLRFAGPRAILTPRVIWTGDGYLVAAMSFEGPNTPLGELGKFTSTVYSFDKDGALRESFPVETGAAVYPNLAWAGGRVALSWVRVEGGATAHYLRYLSCP